MAKQLNVRLPDEVVVRLDELARKTRRTKAYYVREAILEHLEDLEDYYLAIDRLEKNHEAITIDEVERQLGLDD